MKARITQDLIDLMLIPGLSGHEDRVRRLIKKHLDALGVAVPERALAAQDVLICVGEGRDVPGVIANKSHHATAASEKYTVVP